MSLPSTVKSLNKFKIIEFEFPSKIQAHWHQEKLLSFRFKRCMRTINSLSMDCSQNSLAYLNSGTVQKISANEWSCPRWPQCNNIPTDPTFGPQEANHKNQKMITLWVLRSYLTWSQLRKSLQIYRRIKVAPKFVHKIGTFNQQLNCKFWSKTFYGIGQCHDI